MAKAETRKRREDGARPEPSFEESLTRLEEIVDVLDDGNLPLDESLALFKEGTKLAKTCRELLAAAEVQVKEALREAGGHEQGGDASTPADDVAEDAEEE